MPHGIPYLLHSCHPQGSSWRRTFLFLLHVGSEPAHARLLQNTPLQRTIMRVPESLPPQLCAALQTTPVGLDQPIPPVHRRHPDPDPGLCLLQCHQMRRFPSGNASWRVNSTRAFLCDAPGLNIYVGKKHAIDSSRSEIMKLRCVRGRAGQGGVCGTSGEGEREFGLQRSVV